MQSSLKLVDCVIEVHDARISFHAAGEHFYKAAEAAGRFPALHPSPLGNLVCSASGPFICLQLPTVSFLITDT